MNNWRSYHSCRFCLYIGENKGEEMMYPGCNEKEKDVKEIAHDIVQSVMEALKGNEVRVLTKNIHVRPNSYQSTRPDDLSILIDITIK